MPRDRMAGRPADPGDQFDERGTSLVELAMAMLLLGIVCAICCSALISAQRVVNAADLRSQGADQVRVGVASIDRQVRSGNVLYNPANDPSTISGVPSGYSIRVYTQANGNERCVQWRVTTTTVNGSTVGELQLRAWSTTWQTDGNVSGWQNVAGSIVNYPGSPASSQQPFTLDTAHTPYGNRIVDVDLISTVPGGSLGSTTQGDAEDQAAVTGRNTEYGYDPNVCGGTSPTPAPATNPIAGTVPSPTWPN